ncbi:stemmadenine O-acetyltransferase-like [Lycium barbarum]|uniref:stemmadenine O-acetyltransferase-like n=1 Tax=Lycium barbarum TaxID=112863 RepID=UPI00293F3509|nr:stemmadenine O-acetyltransferase-like [Lycium barbarum]
MDIKVEIISKEIIKPSSPSPKSPISHKLSLLDQKAPNCYTTFVLFYHKNSSSNLENIFDSLKVSLSKTLNHMNPLAGRVKDGFTVDCNGQGIDFLRAKVHEDMSNVLKNVKIQVLRKLLPMNPLTRSDDNVLLALQINCFDCGGIAIGVCISHLIADGSSIATFLNTWASVCLEKNDSINISDNLFMDCTSVFPPKEVHNFSVFKFGKKDQIPPKMAARRFVFDESNILALKTNADCSTSRVEAVLAFVWEAVIAAMQKRNNNNAIKNGRRV